LTNKNFISGLIFLTLGVVLYFILIPFGIDEPKKIKYKALSPSYYPNIVAIILIFLGILISIKAKFFDKIVFLENNLRNDFLKRYFTIFIVLVIFANLLNPLGFIISSTLVLFYTFYFAEEKNYFLITILSLTFPLFLYFIFLKIARIPIPTGLLSVILDGL